MGSESPIKTKQSEKLTQSDIVLPPSYTVADAFLESLAIVSYLVCLVKVSMIAQAADTKVSRLVSIICSQY